MQTKDGFWFEFLHQSMLYADISKLYGGETALLLLSKKAQVMHSDSKQTQKVVRPPRLK
jgi:hypothetical protein